MSSANFKPKRTAAVSRNFLATARLSCFYMRFAETAKVTYKRSCDVPKPWDDPVDDACKLPYILHGGDGEVHSTTDSCYCRLDKCNGIGGWTTETLFERPTDAPGSSKPAAIGGKTGGSSSSAGETDSSGPKEEPAAVSGQSGPSADPVMTVGVVVLFISVIVAQLLLL